MPMFFQLSLAWDLCSSSYTIAMQWTNSEQFCAGKIYEDSYKPEIYLLSLWSPHEHEHTIIYNSHIRDRVHLNFEKKRKKKLHNWSHAYAIVVAWTESTFFFRANENHSTYTWLSILLVYLHEHFVAASTTSVSLICSLYIYLYLIRVDTYMKINKMAGCCLYFEMELFRYLPLHRQRDRIK